ncbi:hypothetical protein [Pseudonocardia nigra]|uniref:hypothetical protein n=1 Tax=Pseudonocardia nigra TaxID=1921578 RepID=UPI0027E31416|nr:hypothetical protein [Pseudonocardia nigra]
MAPGRPVEGEGARRPARTPLRRGTAVIAVTGGAFSLVGAAAPTEAPTVVPAVVPAAQQAPTEAGAVLLPAVEPVLPNPDVVDASELVKAVQLAEEEIARLAAERAAAEERAARERAEAEERAARERAAAERERAEAQAATAAAATGGGDCGLDTSGLGAVKPHVRDAAEYLDCRFGEPAMHGVAGRAGTSDHPSGKALDFMVDRATGDALAACALRNKEALGITYVIWEQQINHGGGWEAMEDRGGATANHFDHVHISFGSGGGSGALRGC